MKRALVLGGGMIGSTVARDLSGDFDVTVADVRPDVLVRLDADGLRTVRADLADPAAVARVADGQDVVVGALSSTLGFQTLRTVIEAGRNFVDISFMREDARALDPLARRQGVCCVVDCGVAPGLSNLLAGYAATQLDPCERIDIYAGGLPVERPWPYQYKAGFAPSDVIEEYTRPARIKVGGKVVVREALSEPELIDFPELGMLEASLTDGLRSLLATVDVPNLNEKTLRWPGHSELMRVLRHTGFFGKEPIKVGRLDIRPLDVTSVLLFPKWTFAPGEADVTVLRVSAVGRQSGRRVRRTWDLVDRHDPATDTRSMSRATAFPAAIMARLVAAGRFATRGVHAPEVVGARPGMVDWMLAELARRGVRVAERVEAA